MKAETINPYDEIPYPSGPYPQTHPDQLATIATLFAMAPPPVERCRVLELGCADGSNIIPMAFTLPESRFVGIDLSQRQIETGRRLAEALGLTNLELRRESILELDAQAGSFDYIMAHGVFSWVPDEVQEAMLALCARHLAPNGIAYISYNTYPGWHMRRMLRDMMLYHTRRFSDTGKRLEQARALAQFLAESVPTEGNPYGLLLKTHLDELKRWNDSYLRHDALEEVNDPIYFHRFIERAERHGLRYLGEAEFHTMLASNFPANVSQTLNRVGRDIVEMEQYMDFVRNRTFRQTLLCRKDVALCRNVGPDRVTALHVVSSLRPPSSSLSAAGMPETFRNDRGGTLAVQRPLVKMAFHLLADAWPQSIPFQTLLSRARAQIRASSGDESEPASAEADQRALGETLLVGYSRNLLSFHARQSPFVAQITDRPVASALARLQACSAGRVTNQRHDQVELDAVHRFLLRRLDGSRDRETLLRELREAVLGGDLAPRQAIDHRERTAALVADQLEPCLQRLARAALLVG